MCVFKNLFAYFIHSFACFFLSIFRAGFSFFLFHLVFLPHFFLLQQISFDANSAKIIMFIRLCLIQWNGFFLARNEQIYSFKILIAIPSKGASFVIHFQHYFHSFCVTFYRRTSSSSFSLNINILFSVAELHSHFSYLWFARKSTWHIKSGIQFRS